MGTVFRERGDTNGNVDTIPQAERPTVRHGMGMKLPERAFARPQVSVVIPTRNRRRLLALALASVLDQRDVVLEVIVVDDASTEASAASPGRLGDARVRTIRHDAPHGPSAARNRGIAEAKGEWIAFLDDDDVWAPEKLAAQLQALAETGRRWAYTGAVNIAVDHRILGGAPPRDPATVAAVLPRLNAVPGGCSNVIVHRAALPPEGFDGGLRLCQDWDLWIRLNQSGPPAWVPRPLVAYRVHGENASLNTAAFLADLEVLERRYGGRVDRVAFYRHLARVCLRANRQGPATGFYLRAVVSAPRYLAQGFFPDMAEVLRTFTDRVRARLGRRPRARVSADRDPYRAWKEEARAWLEPFVLQHGP